MPQLIMDMCAGSSPPPYIMVDQQCIRTTTLPELLCCLPDFSKQFFCFGIKHRVATFFAERTMHV